MIISPQRHEGTKVHEVFYYLVRHQDAKEHEVFGLISAAKTTSKETRNRGIQEFDQKRLPWVLTFLDSLEKFDWLF
jgi:hypothetical protein